MTAPPEHDGLWCECTLAPLDDSREWLVTGYRAPTPRLALRWLQHHTRRLANLTDPHPDMVWVPAEALCRVPDVVEVSTAPDPAAELRAWPDDVGEHDQALATMREGLLYRFAVDDGSLRYRFTVRPILTAASPQPTMPGACGRTANSRTPRRES
ncbi:hypothetical protein [Streptomyces sp. ODS28]|uniref:hypothetical protein n=1 Tax=Streptomyces sp. ODS28 TaxID=3136688 RepID=UPI0031ED27CA